MSFFSVRSSVAVSGRLLLSSCGSSQLSMSILSTAVDTPVGLRGRLSRDAFCCAAYMCVSLLCLMISTAWWWLGCSDSRSMPGNLSGMSGCAVSVSIRFLSYLRLRYPSHIVVVFG